MKINKIKLQDLEIGEIIKPAFDVFTIEGLDVRKKLKFMGYDHNDTSWFKDIVPGEEGELEMFMGPNKDEKAMVTVLRLKKLTAMAKYRKKPVVIEAFQWTGDEGQLEEPSWIVDAMKHQTIYFLNRGTKKVSMFIDTLEGVMAAKKGDYIIKGVEGEIYPCDKRIFHKTYEKVAD